MHKCFTEIKWIPENPFTIELFWEFVQRFCRMRYDHKTGHASSLGNVRISLEIVSLLFRQICPTYPRNLLLPKLEMGDLWLLDAWINSFPALARSTWYLMTVFSVSNPQSMLMHFLYIHVLWMIQHCPAIALILNVMHAINVCKFQLLNLSCLIVQKCVPIWWTRGEV